MLRWRLILGTLIIAALAAICYFDDVGPAPPGLLLLAVALAAAMLATKEVLDLAARAQLCPLRSTVYYGNLLLILCNLLPLLAHSPTRSTLAIYFAFSSFDLSLSVQLVAFAAAVLLVVVGEMCCYRKPGGNIGRLAVGVFTLVYVGVLLNFAVQLRLEFGIGALVAWIVVVKMGDTGAYFVGRLIGRHKLAPAISPGKTVEGAFGEALFSCAGAWAMFQWVVPHTAYSPKYGWIVFGLLVGLTGMVGDLVESLLKRDVGVKDSSTWMPGFGGVLDILDSLLLSAPVAWFCWAAGLVG
jgi:phosphatidate cytidylyltransferase